jgi:hypothetical protein
MRYLILPLFALACSNPEPWPNQVSQVHGYALPMPLQAQSSFAIDPAFSDEAHEEILAACAGLNVAFPQLQLVCGDEGNWAFVSQDLPGDLGGQAFEDGNVIGIDEARIREWTSDTRFIRHAVMHEVIHELGFSDHFEEDESSLMYPELVPVFCIDQATVDVISVLRPELAPGAAPTCS